MAGPVSLGHSSTLRPENWPKYPPYISFRGEFFSGAYLTLAFSASDRSKLGGQAGRICLLLSGLTRPIEVGFTFPAPFLESSEQAGSFWDISWLCLRIMEASKLHLKAKFGHIFKRREQKFLKICQSLRFSQTGSNPSGRVPAGFFWLETAWLSLF